MMMAVFCYYDRTSYERYGNYDYNQPDPQYNGYYADRYYRKTAVIANGA
jgi:hypothetical protein